jgi:hypothetical protein
MHKLIYKTCVARAHLLVILNDTNNLCFHYVKNKKLSGHFNNLNGKIIININICE